MSKGTRFCLMIGATLCLVGACHTKPRQIATRDEFKHAVDALRNVPVSACYKLYERINFHGYLPNLKRTPRVTNVKKIANGVRYIFDDGSHLERSGGTIAWRNYNPGCIRYTNNAVAMGAVGEANGFAVFPDEQTGMNAIKTLLTSENYRDLTIARAITKYAPPHENNTNRYIANMCHATGLNQNQKICDLNDTLLTKVVLTIRKLEGWIEGNEKVVAAPFAPEIDQYLDKFEQIKGIHQLPMWAKTL